MQSSYLQYVAQLMTTTRRMNTTREKRANFYKTGKWTYVSDLLIF
jgi:hypothetical protein